MFLVANYFLWNYPRSAQTLASPFQICEDYAQGDHLWIWVKRVAGLKAKVIYWDQRLDDAATETVALTFDGTDYRVAEKMHKTMPIDKGMMSQKFKHAALKYEVGMSTQTKRCVWIHGPVRGGLNDKTLMQQSKVLDKIKEGKLAVVDRGYINHQLKDKLTWPNSHHDPATNNYLSRLRLRQETFHGRLKQYAILKETFRHNTDLHRFAMEAVAVLTQYDMDNGHPLFT